MKFIPFTEEFLDRWIIVQDSNGLLEHCLDDTSINDPEINAFMGFVYADYTAGISLTMEYFLVLGAKGQILKSYSLEEIDNSRQILRFDICENLLCHPVSAAGLKELNLDPIPAWTEIYERHEDGKWMRKQSFFKPFKAPGYAYDLQFKMCEEGLETERVWGRFSHRLPQESLYALELLNEPHQDFGVHQGDFLPVLLTQIEGDDYLVWMPNFGKLQVAELEEV